MTSSIHTRFVSTHHPKDSNTFTVKGEELYTDPLADVVKWSETEVQDVRPILVNGFEVHDTDPLADADTVGNRQCVIQHTVFRSLR